MYLLGMVLLTAIGLAGLYFKIDYAGAVLFIALLGVICAPNGKKS